MALSDFRSKQSTCSACFPSDIPCSLSKPVSGSCCLYSGVHIAGKQVAAMLVPSSLPEGGFAARIVVSLLYQQFTRVHLPNTQMPFLKGFSLSVHHHRLTALAAQSILITPPVQRYRRAKMLALLFSIFERTCMAHNKRTNRMDFHFKKAVK